jgi:hypothetical protein
MDDGIIFIQDTDALDVQVLQQLMAAGHFHAHGDVRGGVAEIDFDVIHVAGESTAQVPGDDQVLLTDRRDFFFFFRPLDPYSEHENGYGRDQRAGYEKKKLELKPTS